MILIGENIHIISKQVKTALENRDENFVKNLLKIQQNFDAVDLNVGLAKGKLDNIFEWLGSLVEEQNISFDSSNMDAIEEGLRLYGKSNSFINSTSADDEKLERLSSLAVKHNCNLIALAMSNQSGIPKSADGRLELVFSIYEKCMAKGIESDKLYFDPLVLPIKIDQSQALESLNTIKMIKESFDPPVKTVIGLSNISNGVPKHLRPLINQVFGVLAYGAGLDAAIVDARDDELFRIFKMLENKKPQFDKDILYINLANMIECFEELENIVYDKNDKEQCAIVKIAGALLNRTIYSDSFAQI